MSIEQDLDPVDGIFTCLGEAHIVPPEWVIKDLLPVGITFLAGPPKNSRKSAQALAMTLMVAGLKCEALPINMREVVRKGTALVFSAEANAGVLRHTAEVGMQCPVPDNKSVLVADDPWRWRLDDPDALTQLLGWLNQRKPRILVIDPLRDYHALEEKDDGGMNRLLRPLQRWAVDNQAAVLIVHHTKKKGKDDGDYEALDMRGTSALFAIADAVLMVTPRQGDMLHVKATFKRGHEGWARDFRMGIWGKRAEGGVEQVPVQVSLVWASLRAGARNYGEIAKQLGVSKTTVVECMASLEHIGAVMRDGRTITLNPGGDAIVKQATEVKR